MKRLRYQGSFMARTGTVWRVEILQEADTPYERVGELSFPASEPLVIEWSQTEKEEPVIASTATLKIISPSDRAYLDLYTIEPGRIRLDVYRDSALYWSGALDPEFYEEPYERASGYEVSLTFSDFGILDRLKYTLTGMQDLRTILLHALSLSCIAYGSLLTDCVSTRFPDGSPITGGALSVRSDNFIDEDGEPASLREAVEGILQPLALRIVQREGNVHLYDLNGLYLNGPQESVSWDGDSQTLGTDRVANSVKISFSPYAEEETMADTLEYGGEYDESYTNYTNTSPSYTLHQGYYFTYYNHYGNQETGEAGNYPDFTIFYSAEGDGLAGKGTGVYYAHILPLFGSASEMDCLAYAFRTGGHGPLSSGWPQWAPSLHQSVPMPTLDEASSLAAVFTTRRVFLPALGETDRGKFWVRLKQEILIDARYNPFTDAANYNEEGNQNALAANSEFAFIPVRVTLYSAAGEALYHYKNVDRASGACPGYLNSMQTGEWASGADPGGDSWLEYYASSNLASTSGLTEWKANRHCIGRPDGGGERIQTTFTKQFREMGEGEYMPYPPCGGYLEVQVLEGALGYPYATNNNTDRYSDREFAKADPWRYDTGYGVSIRQAIRWCLYKHPIVELVRNNLRYDSAQLDDVVYTGWLDPAAKEEISIDTVCGTPREANPTARGMYFRTSTGEPVLQLRRDGPGSEGLHTACPERLLIGTLHSQYATRKTTLSGEALISSGLCAYTERNQEGKYFLLTEDVQDLISSTTDAAFCEFAPDEYTAIEETDEEE